MLYGSNLIFFYIYFHIYCCFCELNHGECISRTWQILHCIGKKYFTEFKTNSLYYKSHICVFYMKLIKNTDLFLIVKNNFQFINLLKTYKILNFLALYYSGSILDSYSEKHYWKYLVAIECDWDFLFVLMATLLLHYWIYLMNFAKCCLKKVALAARHYCDNCAIMSFKPRQEMSSDKQMNRCLFDFSPVAFNAHYSKIWFVTKSDLPHFFPLVCYFQCT